MIVGTGIDIIECDRLEKSLDKFGQSFVDYFCTAAEQAAAPPNQHARLVYFAARWAAKEACATALGTGFGADCGWKTCLGFGVKKSAADCAPKRLATVASSLKIA